MDAPTGTVRFSYEMMFPDTPVIRILPKGANRRALPVIAQLEAQVLWSCPTAPIAGAVNWAATTGSVVPRGQSVPVVLPPLVEEPDEADEPDPTGGGKEGNDGP